MAKQNTYDPEKDKLLQEIGITNDNIKVNIYAYNGSAPKVGINRVYTRKDGVEKSSALGRITLDELENLLPLLSDAVDYFGEA